MRARSKCRGAPGSRSGALHEPRPRRTGGFPIDFFREPPYAKSLFHEKYFFGMRFRCRLSTDGCFFLFLFRVENVCFPDYSAQKHEIPLRSTPPAGVRRHHIEFKKIRACGAKNHIFFYRKGKSLSAQRSWPAAGEKIGPIMIREYAFISIASARDRRRTARSVDY